MEVWALEAYGAAPEGEFEDEFDAQLGLVEEPELIHTPSDRSGRRGGGTDAERVDRDDTV